MAKASLVKQLTIETGDNVGVLEEVSAVIAGAKVNITAICAYSMEGKACFMVITSDNSRAREALGPKGYTVKEEDVVTVMLDDRVGQAQELSAKIKAAGINLCYMYGTTCGCTDSPALIVLGSKENDKVIAAING
ncbi:hypothetical protein ACFL96_14815 [Thermoproteota archaeon]